VGLRRRLEGVAEISISQSRQTTEVKFAAAPEPFSPGEFRQALDDAGVELVSLQIDACGIVEERRGQRWLVAGRNQFLLGEHDTTPVGRLVCVSGVADDRSTPLRLQITNELPPQPAKTS
jgi:hypothetical protein